MFRNYFKVALRNIARNKVSSFINIVGLAVGMSVAILIGLWMYDEFSYDKGNANYDKLAQVKQHNIYNGQKETQPANPYLMAEAIRNSYGSNFKYVIQSSWTSGHILTYGDKRLTKVGNFFEPPIAEMLDLKMVKGTRAGLKEPYSILLSESVAKSYFGSEDPMNKTIRIDDKSDVKVTGVYKDIPNNSSFRDLSFITTWDLYIAMNDFIRKMDNPWGSNFTQTYVQLADNADLGIVSKKIRDVKLNKLKDETDKRYKPEVFLFPMNKWHLYGEFKNGINTGGRIQFVWLFGIIGLFVLLLACINFMNLATARSEKRAKEVGIRKTIGSERSQLILQFFCESLLVVAFSYGLSILLAQLILPFFNGIADKKMTIPWGSPYFWLAGIIFSLFTGLVAGSYPALYLSSFQPIKVLKGTFRVGRFASVPRKVLVVFQFTVSVALIIGTIIVFRQIQYAKNRPLGYMRDGLITFNLATPDIHNHFEAVRTELKGSEAIAEMTESTSPTTEIWRTNGGFNWKDKDPNLAVDFPNNGVTPEYGKTVGWQFKEGRDFSREFLTDSATFIINESAAKFMGLQHPVNEILTWDKKPFRIIGVIKDMVVQSPYQPVRPSLFFLSREQENVITLKLNPNTSTKDALAKIEAVFRKYNPASPFEYKFVDEDFARKFGDEERIGKLASFFAILAVFISCLGLFGLASFVAEQRTKEIGVRKVLGASLFDLWTLLSKDFVTLVLIALVIATPVAYFFMRNWINDYPYRTNISWWIFAAASFRALFITLLTVSYQAIKAALANPVRSLRTE